jgi:acetylxylan esterase
LTHGGGGDSEGLAAMVTWALAKYNGDASKVFIIGGSSGAMEANVLAATYPELFNAAVSYSGVPAACWAGAKSSTPLASDTSCPMGQKHYTAQQWGDLARSCYSGYNGTRPRMMIVHGTADTAVNIALLKDQLDQWSNVLGVSFTQNVTNTPTTNWKMIQYGNGTELVGYEVQGGGHIPPFQADATFKWWGLI